MLESSKGQLTAFGLLVVFTLILRAVLLGAIRRQSQLDPAARLRWIAGVRTLTLILLWAGIVTIWGTELREFVISIVVLASALVVATKELILGVLGAFLRTSSRAFEVGDRIEIDGTRGDVIDTRLFSTTLLEIGAGHQRTGRKITIPNALLLSKPIANETFTETYVLHTFEVELRKGEDWEAAENRLREVAREVCADHEEPAAQSMNAVGRRHGLTDFSVSPRVTVHPSGESVKLRLRVPTPARERGPVEQLITREFLRRSSHLQVPEKEAESFEE